MNRTVYTTFQSSYWLGWGYLNGLIKVFEKEINIWKPTINSGQSGHIFSHELCGGLLGRLVLPYIGIPIVSFSSCLSAQIFSFILTLNEHLRLDLKQDEKIHVTPGILSLML